MTPTRRYELKLQDIVSGQEVTLTPAEFLHYILVDRDGNHSQEKEIFAAFEEKLGYAPNHLQSNVMNRTYELTGPMAEKLAELSTNPNHNYLFWRKPSFSSHEATDVRLDMTKDISDILIKHQKAGGRMRSRKETPEADWVTNVVSANPLTPRSR